MAVRAAALLAAVFLFFISSSCAAKETIPLGVTADGVDIGGMSREEAAEAVKEHIEKISHTAIILNIQGQVLTTTFSKFGLTWSNPEILEDMFSLGTSGSVISRYRQIKDIEYHSMDFPVTFRADEEKIREFAETLTIYDTDPVDAVIYTTDELVPAVEGGTPGIYVDVDRTVEMISKIVEDWAGEESVTLDVPTDVVEPEVPYEELAVIKDVLGSATTDYSGSIYERCVNIENGCQKISGTLLYPGDYFSLTEAVSPFTEENGYMQAPSYEENRVVDSYGGGICQVSTTLYNAVLRAEMEVTARSNHTMVVTYVDLSMDAAIAEGTMDMAFVNNLSDPVYIIGYTSDGMITFTIYGNDTRPENRSIEFVSNTLSVMEPSSAMMYANTAQSVGYVNQTQAPHTGYTAELWKYIYYDGELSDTIQINSSYYTPVGTIYDIGVASPYPALTQAMYSAIASGSYSQVESVINNAYAYVPQSTEAPQSESSQPESGNPGGETDAGSSPGTDYPSETG